MKKCLPVRSRLQAGSCRNRCSNYGCSKGSKDALGTCWCKCNGSWKLADEIDPTFITG